MAHLHAVDTEFQNLARKQKLTSKRNAKHVASVLQELRKCKEQVAAADVSQEAAQASLQKFKDAVASLNTGASIKKEHRVLHSAIAKATKAVAKVFEGSEASRLGTKPPSDSDKRDAFSVIAGHMYRHATPAGAEKLIRTIPGLKVGLGRHKSLRHNEMLRAFRAGDLGPALTWVESNRSLLDTIGSELEFLLHRLHFVHILQKPESAREAIAYSQRHFHRFCTASTNLPDIQRLMGAVLYPACLQSSPYADLLDPRHAMAVEQCLLEDVAVLAGLPMRGVLRTAYIATISTKCNALGRLDAGMIALPSMVKLRKVMARSGLAVDGVDEVLPVDIELPQGTQFHSVFACPVSRQQAVRRNPPVMLSCGHVLCKEAADQIEGGRSSFKCPTCRVDQVSTARVEVVL